MKEDEKLNVKAALLQDYSKKLLKMEISKLYIIHVKLSIKGWRLLVNPYTFLIQAAAFMNRQYEINHTALVYCIYKDKVLGKTAKYIEATLLGLKVGSLWSLVDKVHNNGGEIWIEEVRGIHLAKSMRKWLKDFVERRILGKKYNFLKAIGSQDFKYKLLAPLNFIFNILGRIGSRGEGFFCTEIVKIIIDTVFEKLDYSRKKNTHRNIGVINRKAYTLHPSQFFGLFAPPQRFL